MMREETGRLSVSHTGRKENTLTQRKKESLVSQLHLLSFGEEPGETLAEQAVALLSLSLRLPTTSNCLSSLTSLSLSPLFSLEC